MRSVDAERHPTTVLVDKNTWSCRVACCVANTPDPHARRESDCSVGCTRGLSGPPNEVTELYAHVPPHLAVQCEGSSLFGNVESRVSAVADSDQPLGVAEELRDVLMTDTNVGVGGSGNIVM